MNKYFITGCGTDCGKTYVTTTLLRYAALHGKHITAIKPVLSGADGDTDDAATLLHAMGKNITHDALNVMSPWRFTAPLSPHRAAELEGREVVLNDVLAYCHKSNAQLIEGVGGVMVPLNYEHSVLDWIVALDVAVLFIASDYLGGISHSLTGLHALHMRGVTVAGIIVNMASDSVEHENMCDTLRAFSPYNAPILSLSRNITPLQLDTSYIHTNRAFFDFATSLFNNMA